MNGKPFLIGALWFGIQVVWGAILGISLQARSTSLGIDDPVRLYVLVATAGATVAAITQVVVGFASDARRERTGHRREFYLAGIALALPALLAFYLAPTYAILLVAFIALQIGMNVVGGPYQAAVPDHVPPGASGNASAWMSGYQFFGQCTGLLIASFAPDALAGVAIAAALAVSFGVTYGHLRGLAPVSAPRAALHVGRNFRTLLLSRGLINLGFYTFVGFMFFFVGQALHVADPKQTTGILFLSFTIAGVFGAALAGRAADRLDKRVVVSVAGAAIALTLGTLAASSSLAVVLVAGTLAGIAWGAFFTADWAIAYVILPTEAMASAMGVWNLAAALPQIVAPLLGAAVVAALGIRATLVLVIVEFALGTLWLWRLPPIGAARVTEPAAR
ncbi:MAG: MFS transporter [Candidatus Eremiobacteraeota bacterium]|nr:MFS transporter [Candidatus Eremiobacteraeota bacterium]